MSEADAMTAHATGFDLPYLDFAVMQTYHREYMDSIFSTPRILLKNYVIPLEIS